VTDSRQYALLLRRDEQGYARARQTFRESSESTPTID